MTITVKAVYEPGVLRPLEPLDDLKEHERMRITVHSVNTVAEQRNRRIKIDPEVVHEIAESPEHDLLAE